MRTRKQPGRRTQRHGRPTCELGLLHNLPGALSQLGVSPVRCTPARAPGSVLSGDVWSGSPRPRVPSPEPPGPTPCLWGLGQLPLQPAGTVRFSSCWHSLCPERAKCGLLAWIWPAAEAQGPEVPGWILRGCRGGRGRPSPRTEPSQGPRKRALFPRSPISHLVMHRSQGHSPELAGGSS